MMIKNQPCQKDCPDRSPICQKSCVALKEYREKKKVESKKKERDFKISCYQMDSIYKNKKRGSK